MKVTIDDKRKTIYICEDITTVEFATWVLNHPEYHIYKIVSNMEPIYVPWYPSDSPNTPQVTYGNTLTFWCTT